MNILLGADSLVAPLTGIGNYTSELLSGLLRSEDVENLYGLNRQGVIHPQVLEEKINNKNNKNREFLKESLKTKIRGVPGAYRLRNIIKKSIARYELNGRYKNYIYHEPNYILMPFSGPRISTIHDLSHIHYPEYHPKERVKYLNQELSKTIEQSDRIITVSEYVKLELVDFMGVEKEKITAIANGVGPQFRPRTNDEISSILREYGLESGYLLCVSTLEPRKNLDKLITAYLDLPVSLQKKFPLVLVGGAGWCCDDLLSRIKSLHHTDRVRYLGYIPAAHLPYIFSGAATFVYPSVYEGFGLPPLEAMASGIPVIVSDSSAMAEVVADAGVVLKTEDVDQLSLAIEGVLDDEPLRRGLASKGISRSCSYSWQRCVAETKELYREVLHEYGFGA
mgnify:CR=1 FL=1